MQENIDEYLEKACALACELRKTPELGYKEKNSSKIVEKYWRSSGFEGIERYGITGLKTYIRGDNPGPTVALIGELDGVLSPGNTTAIPSGEAHACGHHIQTAQVFLAAEMLARKKQKLAGNIVLLAVPAEEFIEIEERKKMQAEGLIRYLSGKPELMSEGAFDDVDIAIMIHAHPNMPDYKLFLNGGNLGFAAINIRFIGKSAHGAEPFEGRNALEAANLFLCGVNANRSTFRDEESIRIHPIITKGGSIVNSVPDDVRIETYVRGASKEAIEKGYRVVERCAKAAAMMIGCGYEMDKLPGYLPLKQDHRLSDVMRSVAENVLGADHVFEGVPSVGSTDFGDLSQMLPAIQPTMGGFVGDLHSAQFKVIDESRSILLGGELLSGTAYELLQNNACIAKDIIASFKPSLTKAGYFGYLDNVEKKGAKYVE